ncbi:Fc.00g083440.m01.CDS01 [Cosmosporella sp. VM-42]
MKQTIGEPGKPPCAKCVREGVDCILAGSHRGGDFSHLRRKRQQTKRPRHEIALSVSSTDHASPRQTKAGEDAVHDNLQNPSDALLILAHAAGEPEDRHNSEMATSGSDGLGNDDTTVSAGICIPGSIVPAETNGLRELSSRGQDHAVRKDASIRSYTLVKDGTVDSALLVQLLRQQVPPIVRIKNIVPTNVLRPECMAETIKHESFLLTSILVVASKDRPDLVDLHRSIWNYMRQLILDVVLGMASIRNVGCVEGLLLLGEWTLLNQGQTHDGGEGAAWSILGLAVRLAYLLRLEESSFKGGEGEVDASIQQQRLAWTSSIIFPNSTMASPDAKNIYEAVDAAESLLRIVTEEIDPEKHLRYMPARFYLYEIHSSVFLYKTHASVAISAGKHVQTASLMQRFISVLKTAAVDENHIASRYAKLLDRLWFHRTDVALVGNTDAEISNLEYRNLGMMDTICTLGSEITGAQMSLFDDIGLQSFDCTDTMDGLFTIPPVFPWDQYSFVNSVA